MAGAFGVAGHIGDGASVRAATRVDGYDCLASNNFWRGEPPALADYLVELRGFEPMAVSVR